MRRILPHLLLSLRIRFDFGEKSGLPWRSLPAHSAGSAAGCSGASNNIPQRDQSGRGVGRGSRQAQSLHAPRQSLLLPLLKPSQGLTNPIVLDLNDWP